MSRQSGSAIALSLLFAVFLWGGSNSAVKFLVKSWPPIWTGSSRFMIAGLMMLALTRWTPWFGKARTLTRAQSLQLWIQGGLTLGVYVVVFNWALRFTSVSHVALYLGASPVWALLWEGTPRKDWASAKRYGAALLALCGVFVLFLPTLFNDHSQWLGEVLGVGCSVLWTLYGRQCRAISAELSGVEISAHTMWRAGLWMLPLAALELATLKFEVTPSHIAAQTFCILGGSILAFGIWNNALKQWPTSKVYLFNNLIPLSTMVWANVTLSEPISPTFWLAMGMIVVAVVIAQTNWGKLWKDYGPGHGGTGKS